MCVLLFSLRHQRTLRVRLRLLAAVGKPHPKRPLHAPGEARQSRRPEGGVLIPRQTPDPGRSVPGFISDSALSSIQSLVYRRASGASAMGRLSSWAMRKETLPRRVWQRSIPSWSPMPSGSSTNRGARSSVDTQLRQSRPHIPGPVGAAWSTQVRGRSDCTGSSFSWPASRSIALWASCGQIPGPLPGQLAIQRCS